MNEPLRVGIIGDFDPQLRYHLATNEALGHAASALSVHGGLCLAAHPVTGSCRLRDHAAAL